VVSVIIIMFTRFTAIVTLATSALLCIGRTCNASTIWTGPEISFSDVAGNDPTQSVNQDRLTSDVWITRGSAQGIFNIEQESGFTHDLSPTDTQWADGTVEAGDPSLLSYTDWNTWAKDDHGGPPSTVGVDAVMHIVSDDIYLDVTFTSWGSIGGGFSYLRSTPAAVPEPGTIALLASVCAGALVYCRRRQRSA